MNFYDTSEDLAFSLCQGLRTLRGMFEAGVREYRETYWTPGYQPRQTEVLAAFRLIPQPEVAPEEAAAAVAAESSTATWTTVWTDRLTTLERYQARAYGIDPVPGRENQYLAYIAYPLELFEEGSVASMMASITGNVFGFKAIRALRLEDLRIPVERDKLNKYGRPLLGATLKPKLGLSARNYGRACFELLRGGLDFTKDDENITSRPFMRWGARFEFVMEAVRKAEQETGERKGHYLNVTAPDCEQMLERAEFARQLGSPIIMHDYLVGGLSAHTTLSRWCRRNGMLLHVHRALHAVVDRQKDHGIHFRVLAKWLRLAGGDHLHTGTVVGKLEGERETTLGVVDLLREDFVPANRARGIYFDQEWASLPAVLPAASGGIHVWHMPALVDIFGDDCVLQFGGGSAGHPQGSRAGATANRVALEACVQARNEGRDLANEGEAILMRAARSSPELRAALETWREVRFDFDTVDTLDEVHV